MASVVVGDALILLGDLLVHALEAMVVSKLEVFERVLSSNEQDVVIIVAERDLAGEHSLTKGHRGDCMTPRFVPKPDNGLAVAAHYAISIFVRETQSS